MTADPWQEFQAMTADECQSALAHLAGRDPEAFARVLEVTRGERERRRGLRVTVAAACQRADAAEGAS